MANARETSVKIAQLKAQLSPFVRAARGGHRIIVCERDTPVARLVPYAPSDETLTSRLPRRAWGSTSLPVPANSSIDSLTALLEERQSGR